MAVSGNVDNGRRNKPIDFSVPLDCRLDQEIL